MWSRFGLVQAKDGIGILQGTPGSRAARPGCCSPVSVSHMVIRLHTALPLWVLLKPIPDLFALKIRNVFISSPTTLSLEISQDFLMFSPLQHVSQLYPLQPCSDSLNETEFG